MTFGRGPLLLQKYIIFSKKAVKTTMLTLKVNDMNRERFNFTDNLFFMSQYT